MMVSSNNFNGKDRTKSFFASAYIADNLRVVAVTAADVFADVIWTLGVGGSSKQKPHTSHAFNPVIYSLMHSSSCRQQSQK